MENSIYRDQDLGQNSEIIDFRNEHRKVHLEDQRLLRTLVAFEESQDQNQYGSLEMEQKIDESLCVAGSKSKAEEDKSA